MTIDPLSLFFFLSPALLLLAVSCLLAFSSAVCTKVSRILVRILKAIRLSFEVENVEVIVRLLGLSGILIAVVTLVIAIYQIVYLA